MKNEFSDISLRLHGLANEIEQSIKSFKLEESDDQNNYNFTDLNSIKYHSTYDDLKYSFKNYFRDEYIKIKNSIIDAQVKPELGFDNYIVVNYKTLNDLIRRDSKFQYDNAHIYVKKQNNNTPTVSFIYWSLFLECQGLLITPLKDFIETNYREILIKHKQIKSPIEEFIDFISDCNVYVESNPTFNKNTSALEHDINISSFNILYNNFNTNQKFQKHLKSLYEIFKKECDQIYTAANSIADNLIGLNNIKFKLSELLSNYALDLSSNLHETFPEKYFNKEVQFKFSQNLIGFSKPENTQIFVDDVYPFISIQFSFTKKAKEFIQFKIDLLKEVGNLNILDANTTESDSNSETQLENINIKLKWRAPINRLITIFYELSHDTTFKNQTVIENDKEQITSFLINNFIDKDGNNLSIDTISTILTPSKVDKRPSTDKRYKIPPME